MNLLSTVLDKRAGRALLSLIAAMVAIAFLATSCGRSPGGDGVDSDQPQEPARPLRPDPADSLQVDSLQTVTEFPAEPADAPSTGGPGLPEATIDPAEIDRPMPAASAETPSESSDPDPIPELDLDLLQPVSPDLSGAELERPSLYASALVPSVREGGSGAAGAAGGVFSEPGADSPGALGAEPGASEVAGVASIFDPSVIIPPGYQEILLDLRFGRLTSTTVQALSDDNVPLLPAFAFFQLAEMEVSRDSAGISAVLYPEGREILLAPNGDSILLNGEVLRSEPGQVQALGEEIFVAAPLLEQMLGIYTRTDWVQLSTFVANPEALPLGQRLARERRWARLQAQSLGRRNAPRMDLELPTFGGAILDWSLSNSMRDPGETLAYSLDLGMRVRDGSLRLSSRSLGPISIGEDRFDASYEIVDEDRSWLTQARFGDGFTTGPRFRDVRGIALTNAPYLRSNEFAVEAFTGQVGPGWDVELRQSGQVLDLTRADERGAFALDIPLFYGQNAIQVVSFGPHGEVITTERVVALNSDLIPGGAFEWGLSGGQCRTALCNETGNLDLRYGLSDRWTLRGGVEGFSGDRQGTVVQPYFQASGLLTQSLQVSAEAVDRGFLRGSATYAPSPWIRFRGAHTAFSSDAASEFIQSGNRRSNTEADFYLRPDPNRPRLFLRASLLDQDFEASRLTRLQTSAIVPIGNFTVEGGLRRELNRLPGPTRLDRDFQFAALDGNMLLGRRHRLFLRGEVELLEGEIMNRLRGRIGYQMSQAAHLELTTTWQKDFGASLSLTFTAFLSKLRGTVQSTTVEGGQTNVTQLSQGTIYWNEAVNGVDFAPGPGVQRGGLSGYVFLDENGNGVRDDGEDGLEGVRLLVAGRPVTTDAEGRHSSWDLVPWQEVDVWTDSASIADPTLVPVRNRVRVDVPPSSFGRLDVPVSPSREMIGRVTQVQDDGSEIAVPYAELELINTETGETRPFQAFSDGEFYEFGIRPGLYQVRATRDYMTRARLVAGAPWPTVVVRGAFDAEPVGPVEVKLYRPTRQDVDGEWIPASPTTSDVQTQVETGRAGGEPPPDDGVESPESGDLGPGGGP